MSFLQDFRESLEREEVRSISRRYFISNGFDGTLTATGVTVGSYLSGVGNGLTVFKVALGAAIGLATSGVWSVWEIERAEKLSELHDMEDSMLTDLKGTEIHEKKMQGRAVNAVMSGLGPVLGVLITASPFLLAGSLITLFQAAVGSVVMGMALLFAFGAYMGNISRQRWYVAGFRMCMAGLVVAALNIFLPG
ncbi:MAG: VIT1/CCC1 transporter family protein [Candidatus Nanohaloarchaea archaeon]